MNVDLDPFASTSFVDLLACSLCVVIVLTLFAGSERSEKRPKDSAVVSIQEVQGSVYFGQPRTFAVAIGDLALVAERMLGSERGPTGEVNASVHLADNGRCDIASLAQGSTVILSNIRAFGFDEADKFRSAVWDEYGLEVIVEPSNDVRTVSIARSSGAKRAKQANIRVLIEDHASDTSVSIWTTSSATLKSQELVIRSPYTNQRSGPVPYRLPSTACVSTHNTEGGPNISSVLLPLKMVTVSWRGTLPPKIEPAKTIDLSVVAGIPPR